MTKIGFLPRLAALDRQGDRDHVCPQQRRKYVLLSAILASSLAFIDGSVVSVAIPNIRADLAADFSQIQWIHNAYILFLSALLLAGGAAGDRYGQRDVFGLGIVIFTLASFWCALAGDPETLILARAVQGLGAAFMVPGSLALIARNYPREIRGQAIGIWAAASGIAAALGPLLGGYILQAFGAGSWRLIFLINLPLGAMALAVLFVRVPRDAPRDPKPSDLPGALLATLSLGLIAYGLTRASEGVRDHAGLLIGLWIGGSVFFVAFLVWESRARFPMMPLSLFRSLPFAGANGLTFLLYFALSGALFYLPMTLIEGWGLAEIWVGFVFLPFTFVLAALSNLAGRLADRTGPRLPLTAGAVISAAAFLGLAIGIETGDYWWGIMAPMILLGCGMGLVVPVLSVAVMNGVEPAQSGIASGINNAVARMAQLFAVAGLGLVAAVVFGDLARQFDLSAGDLEGLVQTGFGQLPADAQNPSALKDAYRGSMISTFRILALITAGLTLAAAGIGYVSQPGPRQRMAGKKPVS